VGVAPGEVSYERTDLGLTATGDANADGAREVQIMLRKAIEGHPPTMDSERADHLAQSRRDMQIEAIEERRRASLAIKPANHVSFELGDIAAGSGQDQPVKPIQVGPNRRSEVLGRPARQWIDFDQAVSVDRTGSNVLNSPCQPAVGGNVRG